MKVVHVTPYYPPEIEFGGPPATVHELCRALQISGVETHVVTTSAMARDELLDGVQVTCVRRRTRLGFLAAVDRALDVSLRDADVCHVHALFNWPAWRGADRAQRQGRPIVVSTRGMLEPSARAHHKYRKQIAWHLMDRRLLANASAVVAATDAEAASLSARGVAPVIVPNAIEMPAALPARGAFRTTHGLADDSRVITFLGRLHPIKRLDLVADAFLDVASRDPRAVLVIAGPDDGGMRPTVAHRLTAVADRVRWLGAIAAPEKWPLLADSDTLLLCSDSESYGRVVAEALASGVPPVVTESCPWSVLETEQIGRWVPQRAAAMADAIVALFSDLPKHRAMSARARAYALRNFSWDQVVAQYVALYQSVSSPTHAPALAARAGF
jgi:glycosyltransferase involved in cell wall biosynthesis